MDATNDESQNVEIIARSVDLTLFALVSLPKKQSKIESHRRLGSFLVIFRKQVFSEIAGSIQIREMNLMMGPL